MALSVSNYTQDAIVNPFQQRNDENRIPAQKIPQENRVQPRQAAAADTQSTETRNERRAEAAADEKADEARSQRRGSTVDITV